jgi:hypothetical protein
MHRTRLATFGVSLCRRLLRGALDWNTRERAKLAAVIATID